MEEKQKKITGIQWMFVIIFALFAMLTAPSFAMVLFFLLAVATMPIEFVNRLWEKVPIKGNWFKYAAICVVSVIAIALMPISLDNDNTELPVVEETAIESENEYVPIEETETVSLRIEETVVPEPSVAEETKQETVKDTQSEKKDTTPDTQAISTPTVSLSDIPTFSGTAYVEVNGNVPYFNDSELTTSAFENYSSLDSLGRCGVAYANICTEIMPTEERESIGLIKPTGWHTIKYDCVDGNYLYNRCHLIGFQLAGENANTKNLITGTRYMNVDGMLPFENMVADYVKETNNHVLYRVTPIFDGKNLVANGVLMEAKSVEDNGEGILFNVFCYNNQPGVIINYADGSSQFDETSTVTKTPATTQSSKEPTTSNQETTNNQTTITTPTEDNTTPSGSGSYVVNGNNGKIHMDGACSATGGGGNTLSNPVYFNSYEEAEAYSISIAPSLEKRKCGNCW